MAHWWAYMMGTPLSSVCVYVCMYVVCMSTISNIFLSETTEPIEVKFHMEPPWGNESLFKQSLSHNQDGHHAHIW